MVYYILAIYYNHFNLVDIGVGNVSEADLLLTFNRSRPGRRPGTGPGVPVRSPVRCPAHDTCLQPADRSSRGLLSAFAAFPSSSAR